ncbi:MAG: terminase large subunit, partial [Flavobacteriaceae bacterium]|nr:terminase large subunit [Flavobacteriaceae bacterium]
KHPDRKKIGKPFELSPFQQFTIYNVFGWLEKETGVRRINEVYESLAKKNGKTAVMAGIGLYGMSGDEEEEAEIYIGATKEEQAKLCFTQAVNFIKKSAALQQIGFIIRQNRIIFSPGNSFMRPLGGDSKTQDGINSHYSIIDEYHAHPDDSVKENLESSSVSRIQPITWHITTAGFNIFSKCKEYEDTCIDILKGILPEDDHRMIMIHKMDKDDDWEKEESWIKANPNWGISVIPDNVRKRYEKAKLQPSKQVEFKTKSINMWVDAPDVWIENEIWKKNKVDSIPDNVFLNQGCYAGLDLATTTDLNALIYLSEPDAEGNRYLKSYFFCPLDTIDKRSKEDNIPYRTWADLGYITATPGNTTDYSYIEDTVLNTFFNLNCLSLEYDRHEANNIIVRLTDKGVVCAPFSQAIGVISWPTKQFEKLVYEGKIKHDGNPVLEWMLSGCVIYRDANDNMKVHKGQSHRLGKKRVDGIVATIMALGGSLSEPIENNQSKYNDPDTEISFGIEVSEDS